MRCEESWSSVCCGWFVRADRRGADGVSMGCRWAADGVRWQCGWRIVCTNCVRCVVSVVWLWLHRWLGG